MVFLVKFDKITDFHFKLEADNGLYKIRTETLFFNKLNLNVVPYTEHEKIFIL